MHIKDQGFIVTGGGSGLGAATVRALAGGGARVLILDVSDAGAALAESLGAAVSFERVDITVPADVESAIERRMDGLAPLRGLINCAGVAPAEKVVGRDGPHSLDAFMRTVQINLVGTFNVLRLVADRLANGEPTADGERGVIVNTASVAAFDGQVGQAGYAASKGGVVAMTLPIARELARFGIRVCTIAPGIMETPMIAGMPANVQEALGAMVPFPNRLGRADEFASLVLHIIDNGYLNGEVIRLDGAIRMAPR